MRIKIIIADEQRISREGLRALFTTEPQMEVIGEAENRSETIDLTGSLAPDVVLMELGITGLNSVETTRRMLELTPAVRVIGLSQEADIQLVRELLAAGGAGFITTKCNGFTDFLTAVHAVMAKRTYLSPDIAQAMVDQYVLRPMGDRANGSLTALSRRENEVLQLVAEGMSTKEVAAALKISTKTVDMHRQHIMGKLGMHSVAELTKYAIRQGLTALHS